MIWSGKFDAPVNNVLKTSSHIAFVCGDGFVRFVSDNLGYSEVKAHQAAILSSAELPGGKLLTGGDDGKVALCCAPGEVEIISKHEGAWINSVATAANGAFAWAAGKMVYYRSPSGAIRVVESPTTPAALAFDPRGRRVAIGLYGSVWVWLPKEKENLVRRLEWKGSHIGVTWSPDGCYIITSMQECELHGWRLKDAANLQMAGYPGKIHSLSWDSKGQSLATSGAPTAIVWPFDGDGPMSRAPSELGFLRAGLRIVKWRPCYDILAMGCAKGAVHLVRASNYALQQVRIEGDGAVTGIEWSRGGEAIAIGTETGKVEIYSLEKDKNHVA